MKHLHTEIEIEAPASRVWDILVDFERYGEWNPFILEISGKPEVGAKLRARMRPVGSRVMTFKPKVLAAEPGKELRWLGRMGVGGIFDGHPWHEKVTVKLDEPEHPLTAAFRGKGFEITDEIYQFTGPYSRKRLRVLLSLDTGKTDMNRPGIKRADRDFPISWVQRFGRGRVFYCSLGHDHDVFWNPAVLRHYLDGIQFALGDLPADSTPSD